MRTPDKTAALLAKSFSGISLDDAKGMLQDVKLPTYAENIAFFDPAASLASYQTIFKSAQGIWRRIGKVKEVFEPYQAVDTRFLEGSAEFFAGAPAAKPEFEFKAPPKPAATAILTKTVLRLLPHRLRDPRREREGGARHPGGGPGGDVRQRLPAGGRQHGQRGQPRRHVRLSRARADAVTQFLVSKGFDRNKFEVVGRGPDQPSLRTTPKRDGPATGARTSKSSPGRVEIREAVGTKRARRLILAGVAAFLGLWCALSYTEIVPRSSCPPHRGPAGLPPAALRGGPRPQRRLSFYRVTMGFVLAALWPSPSGSSWAPSPRSSSSSPPCSIPCASCPSRPSSPHHRLVRDRGAAEDRVPLHGIVVYLLPLVVEAVEKVDDVYLQTATTLGATKWQMVSEVLVPAACPPSGSAPGDQRDRLDLRDPGEVINARYGLGALITVAGKRSHVDQIFALVLVILVIGVVSDLVIRFVNRRLFAWKS